MKRLFLASSGLAYIKEFVGADPSTLSMLFIPTAGNLDQDTWWISKDREVLAKMGFKIQELDIATASEDELKASFINTDIVYIAGGNCFYLLQQLQETGYGDMLVGYIENGGLYAGASAGAVVAGVDIKPVAALDEPEKVPNLHSTQGLALVDIVPVPHYDFQSRKSKADDIKAEYGKEFEIVLFTDDQAIIAEDDSYRIVDSPRGSLEMEWLNNSSDA